MAELATERLVLTLGLPELASERLGAGFAELAVERLVDKLLLVVVMLLGKGKLFESCFIAAFSSLFSNCFLILLRYPWMVKINQERKSIQKYTLLMSRFDPVGIVKSLGPATRLGVKTRPGLG